MVIVLGVAIYFEIESDIHQTIKNGETDLTMIGYDLEKSIDVVRRYGAEASGVTELVRAANMGAEIAPAIVDGMYGQCGRKIA